ncbi:cytochrome P450 [Scleroderma yunnanense]
MVSLLRSSLVAFVVWQLIRRIRRRSTSLANIPGPRKEHWLKGNYHRIFQDGLKYNLDLADTYGGAVRIHAVLGAEQLYISDPLALQHIVIKEQDMYEETDMFILGNGLIFGQGLISTLGEQHRRQRKMLNPVFSITNMRTLSSLIQPIADQLCMILLSQLQVDGSETEINLLPWVSRSALEYVCQGGLGHSFDALNPHNESEYIHAIRMLGTTTLRLLFLRPFIPFFVRNFSSYWRNKMVDWAPIQALKDLRRTVQVMDDASREIFSAKKAALAEMHTDEEPISDTPAVKTHGQDIMSIMLGANTSSFETDRLSDDELVGQMNTMIFAGLETVTSAICRILWILACKPSAQARLRSEIRDAKYASGHSSSWENVCLPYDILNKLPYLDAVVKETLRLHPPTSLLSRTVRQDTVLPLHRPIRSRSGEVLERIPIPKDTTLIISILNANLDRDVWGEDAREWRPDRWLGIEAYGRDENEDVFDDNQNGEHGHSKMPGAKTEMRYPGVYANMMTFLGGGRACIGFKFAEMEIKQVIVTLLSRLHFSLPSVPDEHGQVKEIYWKISALQVPVVHPPLGDGITPQIPLGVRAVRDGDFELS